MSGGSDRLRARVARSVAGLIDPAVRAQHIRGVFATNRVEPLSFSDAPGTDRLSGQLSEAPGIDLRVAEQLSRLTAWTERGQSAFDPIRSDPEVTQRAGTAVGPIENPYFSTPDAEVYFSIITDLAPRRIVEVGGGFSTLIARHAIAMSAGQTELVVIDPEPRTEVRDAADELVLHRVEGVDLSHLRLDPGDILFIDSSHVVRTGGDVTHLLLEVVPSLAAGTYVHVHDVYLPYGYASEYARRLWTEQYLLHALLSGSPRYQVVFATHMMSRLHTEPMRAAFGPTVATEPIRYGQSFWFAVT